MATCAASLLRRPPLRAALHLLYSSPTPKMEVAVEIQCPLSPAVCLLISPLPYLPAGRQPWPSGSDVFGVQLSIPPAPHPPPGQRLQCAPSPPPPPLQLADPGKGVVGIQYPAPHSPPSPTTFAPLPAISLSVCRPRQGCCRHPVPRSCLPGQRLQCGSHERQAARRLSCVQQSDRRSCRTGLRPPPSSNTVGIDCLPAAIQCS